MRPQHLPGGGVEPGDVIATGSELSAGGESHDFAFIVLALAHGARSDIGGRLAALLLAGPRTAAIAVSGGLLPRTGHAGARRTAATSSPTPAAEAAA